MRISVEDLSTTPTTCYSRQPSTATLATTATTTTTTNNDTMTKSKRALVKNKTVERAKPSSQHIMKTKHLCRLSTVPKRAHLRCYLPQSSRSVLFCALVFLSVFISDSLVFAVHVDESTNHIYPVSKHSYKSFHSKDNINKHHSNGPHHAKHKSPLKVFFASGESEDDLPVCSPNSVCNKIDIYGSPWVEKQCRCPSGMSSCSMSTHSRDGRTIVDRTRLLKTCEPVRHFKRCKFFKDITSTVITYPDNSTQQIMHCKCPKNSVSYLIKRHAYQTDQGTGFQYSFACSPQTIRCQRKEPCQLFSVRKDVTRPEAEEVTTNALCQCSHRKKCPKHHLDVGVIPGKIYSEDSLRTYSAYCM
ncbi:protein giant-lens-like isoform X2 [Tigriopus californicus]|uniref:protein giant-lens-like isoform X2 n=1 Tax=Tigriopus californicus TaxID=6832 RepID=UPI0027DA4E24|nr:protein giant-lens-like isoform X2 [Tigriopus californicus]